MNKIDSIEMMDALAEDLIIVIGLLKWICHERNVPLPNSAVRRTEETLSDYREFKSHDQQIS